MVPIIAYNYSAGNMERMNRVRKYSEASGLVFGVVSVMLYLTFADTVMRIFIPDKATIELGAVFLRLRSLATPLMFLSYFHVHLFNGFGEGRYALLLGISRWALFNIPMLFILNAAVGMYGLVLSQVTADILTVVLSVYIYRRYAKKKWGNDSLHQPIR